MSVNRLNKLRLDRVRSISMLYGEVDDYFATADLQHVSRDVLLWRYLRARGYQRIVFYDLDRCLFTLDLESRRLMDPAADPAGQSEDSPPPRQDARPIRSRRFLQRPSGGRPNRPANQPNQNQQEGQYQGAYDAQLGHMIYSKGRNQNLVYIVQEMNHMMSNPSCRTALVIRQGELFYSSQDPLLQQQIRGILQGWCELPPTQGNLCIMVFHYQEAVRLREFFSPSGRDYPALLNLYNRSLGPENGQDSRSTEPPTLFYLGWPEEDEVHSLLQMHRLGYLREKASRPSEAVAVDWPDYELCLSAIAREGKTLQGWHNILLEMESLSVDNLKSHLQNVKIDERRGWDQLNQLIGLSRVESRIKSLVKLALKRKEKGGTPPRLHLCFCGNPGTGKTTVARIVAQIYREEGLLERGHLIETDEKDLVAGYVGQTPEKTARLCQQALDGVLFIDEAYAITQGQSDQSPSDFGDKAVSTLLKYMEDYRDRLVVIVAGYTEPMQKFIDSNPGLKRRFGSNFVYFDDYTADELHQIFQMNLERNGLRATPELHDLVRAKLEDLYATRDDKFGNGGVAETMVQDLQERLGMMEDNNAEPDLLTLEHAPKDWRTLLRQHTPQEEIDMALAELEAMEGLDEVKSYVSNMVGRLRWRERLIREGGKPPEEESSYNSLFMGGPGTGKTTVARIMGRILRAVGVLRRGHVVEVNPLNDLQGRYVGHTAPATQEKIDQALDGILFIDEAYLLGRSSGGGGADFNQETVGTLLKGLEDNRDRLVVIAAGYPAEMDRFLQVNPGLHSRFPWRINFPNYSDKELVSITGFHCNKRGLIMHESLAGPLAELFGRRKAAAPPGAFGNAREARNLLDVMQDNLAARTVDMPDISREDMLTLLPEDLPAE